MTTDALSDLDPERAVSEWSEDLIGYEPTTAAFDPRDDGDRRQLAAALRDAQHAGATALIVRGSDGRLTLWTKASEFWHA